jgi:hypothetical protein
MFDTCVLAVAILAQDRSLLRPPQRRPEETADGASARDSRAPAVTERAPAPG